MSYDLMFQKAIELQNAGALNQAEDIYLKILQVMPENSDVWNLLGLIAQSKGNLTRAEDCFLNAIKYAPTPFFAHFFNLALVYKSLNKLNEAKEAVMRSVQLKPDFKEGFNLLGVLEANLGLHNDAVKSFCKALEVDENYQEARANLCFYSKDFDALYRLATEHPDDFNVQLMTAQASDDLSYKEKYLRRAVDLAPDRTDALLLLADTLREQNNFNEALIFYHKVLNIDENNIFACLGLADIYLAEKNFDKAEKYYLQSFNISRDIAEAHINYGTLLFEERRLNEALEEFRQALQLAPNSPEIRYNLALILKETGDIEEALGLMFDAHLKEPENDVFAINIMETLAILFENNAEAALKIAENWQKTAPDNIFSKRILAALSGSDDEKDNVIFAEKLFDNFAPSYENTLQQLEPNIIKEFMKRNKKLVGHILDLGCGTGLAAVNLKTKDNSFTGVDVSEEMLKLAKQKNLYDELYNADIVSFLDKHPARDYDVVLAFDVFCYLGDLEPVLKALKGTEVWFSVESGDEDMNKDYYLSSRGRYKHKKSAVLSLLKKLKFKSVNDFDIVLRKENGNDVNGVFFHLS